MSKKGLNEVDEFVGGHLSEDAILVIIHSVHQSFQSFNITTKIAKVNEARIEVGVVLKQIIDVIIRRSRSGNGGKGNGGISLREGSKGTSRVGARHSIRIFQLF